MKFMEFDAILKYWLCTGG